MLTCKTCHGFGRVEHTGCPMELVPDPCWEALWLAGCVEDGQWPVGGGVLDQSHTFIDALSVINSIKAEMTNGAS